MHKLFGFLWALLPFSRKMFVIFVITVTLKGGEIKINNSQYVEPNGDEWN